jgi:integrase
MAITLLQDVAAHPQRAGYGRAEASANRIKTVCGCVYSWGREVGLLEYSPFAGRKALYKEKPEHRVLSNEELRAVLLACETMPDDIADLVRLLLLTCTRLSMVLGMTRAEIDADRLLWRVPPDRIGNKNAREHLVPLAKPALAIIKRRLAAHEEEWVFPSTRDRHTPRAWSNPYKALAAFQARANATFRKLTGKSEPMSPWTLNNLRHTAATHLSEDLKVASVVVTRLLAQSPPGAAITRIYDRSELPRRTSRRFGRLGLLARSSQGRRGRTREGSAARETTARLARCGPSKNRSLEPVDGVRGCGVRCAPTVAIGRYSFDDGGDAAAAGEPRLDVGSHPTQTVRPQLQRLGEMTRSAPSPQRRRRDTKLRQDFRARKEVRGRRTHAPTHSQDWCRARLANSTSNPVTAPVTRAPLLSRLRAPGALLSALRGCETAESGSRFSPDGISQGANGHVPWPHDPPPLPNGWRCRKSSRVRRLKRGRRLELCAE